MASDYAARIVARATGEPLAMAHAAQRMAPRGAATAPDADVVDPFDAAPARETGSAAEVSSVPALTPATPPTASVLSHAPPLASDVSRSFETAARQLGRDPAAIDTPAGRHELVAHERIVERVVERVEERETAAEASGMSAVDPPIVRDAMQRETPGMAEQAAQRIAERTVAKPAAAEPEWRPTAPPTAPAPRQLATRTSTAVRQSALAPLAPRAAAHSVSRRAPERPRLVIDRLVVEVVAPAAPAAPRPTTRAAASAPRPFRAGGPSSVVVGRPSGLGQS
jgi:hypothetical protein